MTDGHKKHDRKEDAGKYTFTPIHPFHMDDPRSWGATIGQMNWDNDKIVFSKRSLLEFLKSCQLTVNTNYTEIQKLYATFGRFSKAATDAAVRDLVDAEIADPSTPGEEEEDDEDDALAESRPSRKVVDPPGGKQSFSLYGKEYEEQDALSFAPPKDGGSGVDIDIDRMEHLKLHAEPEADGGAKIEAVPEDGDKKSDDPRVSNPPPNFRPTRKVREGPGGKSQMGAALFGGVEDEPEADAHRTHKKDKNASSGLW